MDLDNLSLKCSELWCGVLASIKIDPDTLALLIRGPEGKRAALGLLVKIDNPGCATKFGMIVGYDESTYTVDVGKAIIPDQRTPSRR
jgi:hypothetical protein